MPDVERMLNEMADSYRRRIADDLSLTVQIEVRPGPRSWLVRVAPGRNVSVGRGPGEGVDVVLTMEEETLRRIHAGEMTALTAAARARMSEPAPLDFELGEGVSMTADLYAALLSFLQRFFNASEPERILLGEPHSRLVHGAHAVALYYHPGFRSAWYRIKKGERLNEPGDTNPFPQAFVFISGAGWARIGDRTVAVRAGESYYVPPGEEHVVWTESEEPLDLIFLAWGEGA